LSDIKVTSRFIKLHAVVNSPGNEVREIYQHVDHIHGYSPAPPEYAKIGASSVIDVSPDRYIYITESVDEVHDLLSQIDLLP